MTKRILAFVLGLVCLLSSFALGETAIKPTEKRNVKIQKAGNNTAPDGISPTTGRKLADLEQPEGFSGLAVTGRYLPMIVQIDNQDGGVGHRAPWNVNYADVVYETPLYRSGETRLSFLFSDLIPNLVGPVRSARVFHAWLREEWDCGFCHYGQQSFSKTNVPAEFSKYGADKKNVLFNGTVGSSKPWKQYYSKRKELQSPHDKGVDAAGCSTLIPADFKPADRAWLFTDKVPEGGDDASVIHVTWGNKPYNSMLEYDEDDKCYYRYMLASEKKPEPYVDYETKEPVPFNNIIVQFTKIQWPSTNAPLPTVTGTGNADYFMGGKHFKGVWSRKEMSDRTVFYGEDGKEIELLPGRTLIIVFDGETKNRSITYEA